MEALPSPKVHDQAVGAPVEMSVNCTDWFVAGTDGEYEKAGTGAAAAGFTVTVFVVEALPEPLVAVRRTVYVPAAAKTCAGFWAVDVFDVDAESPKFQLHDVGELSEASLNWTAWPAEAGFGLTEKRGSGAELPGAPDFGRRTKTLNSGPEAGGAGQPTGVAWVSPVIGKVRGVPS